MPNHRANDAAIIRLVELGYSYIDIAHKTGYSRDTVRQVLRRNGVEDGRKLRYARHKAKRSTLEVQRLIWDTVSSMPGITLRGVARRLDIAFSSVASALKGMDRNGLLLYEDDKAGLYPFGKVIK